MSKRIKSVEHRFGGHLLLHFEDGTDKMLQRGEHEKHGLGPGDFYPPVLPTADDLDADAKEKKIALDTQASKVSVQQRESADAKAKIEDAPGTPSGPETGTREEGQQGAQAQDEQPASA